jgi:hypothetical protein
MGQILGFIYYFSGGLLQGLGRFVHLIVSLVFEIAHAVSPFDCHPSAVQIGSQSVTPLET